MLCEVCGKEFFEDYRRDPKQRLKPARFCSRKCATTMAHTKYRAEGFCLQCGKSLGSGWKANLNSFCSKICAADYRSAQNLQEWLKTGEIPNFTGGKQGLTPRGFVRRYIMEQQQSKCAVCGAENIWKEKPLVFIMDHINGNCRDNRRENLRLLCPNCNSQTPTFSGRNKGKGARPVRKY